MGALKRCRMHKYLRLGIIYLLFRNHHKTHPELRRSKIVDHRPLLYLQKGVLYHNMRIIRGTTPTIVVNVKSEVDFSTVTAIWVYISQMGLVRINKEITDVVFNQEDMTITLKLSQDDTLGLYEGEALFQIRLLLSAETALATVAERIFIDEVYKEGVIS